MEKESKNHILPPVNQRDNDLKAIREVLKMYNLNDNMKFFYLLLKNYDKDDNIDFHINFILKQIEESEGIILIDD